MILRTATVGWSRGSSSARPSITIGCCEPPASGRSSTAAAACTPGSARSRCSARVEERGDLRRRLVACLRQRHLQRQHVARIEAGVDMAQREQAAQHHARRPSAARPTARPRRRSAAGACSSRRRLASRPPSFKRVVEIGAALRGSPAARPRGCRSASTRRARRAARGRRWRSRRRAAPGPRAASRPRRGWRAPAAGPTAPPVAASTSDSTSSCWNTRARPAPSAVRIASSLRRPSARANSRLPTLAHAISSTSATAASSITSDVRMSPTISSCSGTTVAPQPVFSFG